MLCFPLFEVLTARRDVAHSAPCNPQALATRRDVAHHTPCSPRNKARCFDGCCLLWVERVAAGRTNPPASPIPPCHMETHAQAVIRTDGNRAVSIRSSWTGIWACPPSSKVPLRCGSGTTRVRATRRGEWVAHDLVSCKSTSFPCAHTLLIVRLYQESQPPHQARN
jgi:hypothetical protein